MTDKSSELVKILKTAIEVENNGFDTFMKCAEKTKDETGKKMFHRLAEDEREHKTILEKQLKKVTEGAKLETVDIPKSGIEQIIPTVREKVKLRKGESGMEEVDALEAALELERKAAQFFRDNAEKVDEAEAKALFLRLAEWEDAHFELIQAELDYIRNTGLWFGIPEFRMDGKY